MPKSISLPDEIYRRLENLAVGFDTPVLVIERLLNEVESRSSESAKIKPRLIFIPDEASFKNELIACKKAQVVLHFKDGERDVFHWNASRLQPRSNLRANLWSGFLRNWKEKGIISAELSVLPKGLNSPEDNTELLVAIADEIHWTMDEIQKYFIDYEEFCSDDGLPYYYLATFDENTPADLKRVAGLNTSNQLHLDLNIIPSTDELE